MKDRRHNPGVVKEQLRYEEMKSPPINRIVRDRAKFMDLVSVLQELLNCDSYKVTGVTMYEGGMVA